MSDIAVTTQPAEVKPLEETHVPHENGTAVVPQTQDVPVAPVNITPVAEPAHEESSAVVASDAPKHVTQNTEDVDLDIDVESKPDMRRDQASESKQEEYDEESDSDSDSLDLADLDIDLDNIDALDINELQKKQQALLELRNKKQKKLEELLRKQNEQLHQVMPTAAESVAAQYTSQPAGSMSPYPGKRGRGRPRKVPRPGDPEEVILAHLQQQKLKLQQQIQQQQQQLAQAGVDLSQLSALHGSPDYEKKAKERALWTLQESRQLLKILESGKTDPQHIWDELNATVGNTKTFDQVKNKKANLMQKASSKSMTVIDVLKDDIVKLEGELFGFSSESDNEAGSFTSSKRRKVNEAGEYYVPAGSPPIVPSSPGLVFDQGGKRGPGRPRKYARAEDGSVIKQKPLVLPPVETTPVVATTDIRGFLSHKFEELRAAREEDRRVIERQRKIMENMQQEIKYLKFTNQLLLEKFDIDPAAQEERFKKMLAEGESSREENHHSNHHHHHHHSPEHGHAHSNTNALVSSDSQPKSDAMEEEPKTDAMKIE